jgi:type I restriction enzyme, S subunit
MELKKGYKQTEVGVIPEDWEVKKFVEVMDGFSSGQTPYRATKEYYKGNVPWITSGELNYNIITDTIEKITEQAVINTGLKKIPKGTFLMAITGLEAAGTRGSCAITGIDATTNQSCMALYPKKGVLITPYLYHYYVRYGDELAFKYCQGTKQQSFTGGIVKQLPILLPSKIEEQTAIAEALSDADALIQSTEKLIAKKRMVKQAAMQQLLSPKEGWEVKKLGEVFSITAGGDLNTFDFSLISDGKYKYPIYSNAITERGLYGYCEYYKELENTITVTARGTVGVANYRNHKYTAIGRLLILNPYENINCFFASEYINNKVKFTNESTGVPQLTAPQISKHLILLPEYEEQTRIATILSDMDAEITALEAKLQKYRHIKQGMMQNLLTGKIRLV